jgi:hypothetical protein
VCVCVCVRARARARFFLSSTAVEVDQAQLKNFAGLDALRRNRHGVAVSSNLGDYTWFNCSDDGQGRQCAFAGVDFQTGGAADSPTAYFEGLASFVVAAVAVAAGVLIFLVLLVVFRYCCCCCCGRRGRCQCGSKFPTKKTCMLGYSLSDVTQPAYSRIGTCITQILLSVFLTLIMYVSACGRVGLLCAGDCSESAGRENASV